jgi:hypothetical protein
VDFFVWLQKNIPEYRYSHEHELLLLEVENGKVKFNHGIRFRIKEIEEQKFSFSAVFTELRDVFEHLNGEVTLNKIRNRVITGRAERNILDIFWALADGRPSLKSLKENSRGIGIW